MKTLKDYFSFASSFHHARVFSPERVPSDTQLDLAQAEIQTLSGPQTSNVPCAEYSRKNSRLRNLFLWALWTLLIIFFTASLSLFIWLNSVNYDFRPVFIGLVNDLRGEETYCSDLPAEVQMRIPKCISQEFNAPITE